MSALCGKVPWKYVVPGSGDTVSGEDAEFAIRSRGVKRTREEDEGESSAIDPGVASSSSSEDDEGKVDSIPVHRRAPLPRAAKKSSLSPEKRSPKAQKGAKDKDKGKEKKADPVDSDSERTDPGDLSDLEENAVVNEDVHLETDENQDRGEQVDVVVPASEQQDENSAENMDVAGAGEAARDSMGVETESGEEEAGGEDAEEGEFRCLRLTLCRSLSVFSSRSFSVILSSFIVFRSECGSVEGDSDPGRVVTGGA